jgi:hypothetical protein
MFSNAGHVFYSHAFYGHVFCCYTFYCARCSICCTAHVFVWNSLPILRTPLLRLREVFLELVH